MSGLDGLGWPNPEDEPKREESMKIIMNLGYAQIDGKIMPAAKVCDDIQGVPMDILTMSALLITAYNAFENAVPEEDRERVGKEFKALFDKMFHVKQSYSKKVEI